CDADTHAEPDEIPAGDSRPAEARAAVRADSRGIPGGRRAGARPREKEPRGGSGARVGPEDLKAGSFVRQFHSCSPDTSRSRGKRRTTRTSKPDVRAREEAARRLPARRRTSEARASLP